MHESSRVIAGKQIRTWTFDGADDYVKHRDLIPLHERRRYDMMYNYQESSGRAATSEAIAFLSPETASTEGTLTPSFSSPTVSPVTIFDPLGQDLYSPTSVFGSNGLNNALVDQDPHSSASILGHVNFPIGTTTSQDPNTSTLVLGRYPPASTPLRDWFSILGYDPVPVFFDLVNSIPVLLRVQYLRPHMCFNKYHYFLPPPPSVDVVYLQEDSRIAHDTLLPVSSGDPKGLHWLYMDMESIWQKVRAVVAAEYDGNLVDIGLAPGRWMRFKTEHDGKVVSLDTRLGDLMLTFKNQKAPRAGQPLIIVVEDEIPYSEEPSIEFGVPVQGNDASLEAGNSLSNVHVGFDEVPPQDWCRVGNAYMLMEGDC